MKIYLKNGFPSPLEVDRFISVQIFNYCGRDDFSFRPLSRWIGLYHLNHYNGVESIGFPSPLEVDRFISQNVRPLVALSETTRFRPLSRWIGLYRTVSADETAQPVVGFRPLSRWIGLYHSKG